MAYVPDGLAQRRRREKVSPNAFDIFQFYCECADQDTAFAFPSIQAVATELDMRLDHAKNYNAELIKAGWIVSQVLGNRDGYLLKAGYLTRSERTRKQPVTPPQTNPKTEPETEKTASQNLGNQPAEQEKRLPKTWEASENSTQDLVKSSQNLGNGSQNLGTAQELQNSEVFSEPAFLTSPLNQPIEPSIGESTDSPPVGSDGEPPKVPAKPPKPETYGKLRATEAEKLAIEECFDFWVELDCRKNTKLIPDSERWTATLKRLREGFTVEEIKAGIRGIKFSPHHQGQNDRQTKYDDLFHVCKSPENLEKFIRLDADSSIAHLSENGKSPPKNSLGTLSAAGAATAAKMDNIAKEWGFK